MRRTMMSRRNFRAARGSLGTPVAATLELAGARVSGVPAERRNESEGEG
jgi:hypothetical protein